MIFCNLTGLECSGKAIKVISSSGNLNSGLLNAQNMQQVKEQDAQTKIVRRCKVSAKHVPAAMLPSKAIFLGRSAVGCVATATGILHGSILISEKVVMGHLELQVGCIVKHCAAAGDVGQSKACTSISLCGLESARVA